MIARNGKEFFSQRGSAACAAIAISEKRARGKELFRVARATLPIDRMGIYNILPTIGQIY